MKHIALSALILTFLFTSGNPALGQEEGQENRTGNTAPNKGFDPNRLFTGGNFGMGFGSIVFIIASPVIGYKVTDRYHVGIGATYIYYRQKLEYSGYILRTSYYGGRLFNRYFVLENLFAHLEYELLNIEYFTQFSPPKTTRRSVGSFLVGGGYAQPISRNSSWNIMVLYNLNENLFSYYPNPMVRFGITLGF